jgi:hypothetical protein
MSAIRLPLLYAFAGGCLSNVVMFGLWRAAEGTGGSAVRQQHPSHNVVEVVATASVAQPSELVSANAADREHDATTAVAPTPVASDVDSAGPTPAGSAVSDVLARLETAYRERVAARAPAQPSSTPERATATAPEDSAVAVAEPAAGVPAQPAAEVIPAMPVAVVTEPRATAPAALPPQVVVPALPPQVAAMPAVAGPDAPPPTEIHYGDVNQNTFNITNVREGDVYLVQLQQVAMLQYMQLLGMSPGMAAPARHAGGAGRQRGTFMSGGRSSGALSSGITNPDNPWGFHFAPPNLVR